MADVPCRYVTYPFYWQNQPFTYTPKLRPMLEGLPAEYHVALQTCLDGPGCVVDATWDPALQRASFPVELDFDATRDSLLAVEPIDMVIHANVKERLKYVAEAKSHWTDDQRQRMNVFYEAVNLWMDDIRSA